MTTHFMHPYQAASMCEIAYQEVIYRCDSFSDEPTCVECRRIKPFADVLEVHRKFLEGVLRILWPEQKEAPKWTHTAFVVNDENMGRILDALRGRAEP